MLNDKKSSEQNVLDYVSRFVGSFARKSLSIAQEGIKNGMISCIMLIDMLCVKF